MPLMDSTWLDGWVGAAVAAALTVGATVSWEARARRRELLDAALAEMSAAADEMGMAVLNLGAADASQMIRPVLTASLRASALAGRPVGLIPARWLAPLRWRMAGLLESTVRSLGAAIGDIDEEAYEPRAKVAGDCGRLSLIALLWWRRPSAFLRPDPLRAAEGWENELADGLTNLRGETTWVAGTSRCRT